MPKQPFDIVLIIADTYRKDNAAMTPESGLSSPFFDKLKPFYGFNRCFSSAPWTLPACSSILSGIDSSTHGYFFHDRPLGRPTIGAYLHGDFQCMAIVNNRNFLKFTGFQKDFDQYLYYPHHQEPFESARKFLTRQRTKQSSLLFFHTNIPHDYYKEVSREYYQEVFPDRDDWFHVGARLGNWAGLSPNQRIEMRSIYDASARHMEEKLAVLLDLIDLDRSILCFVADHGEGFDYERARIHHGGRLHDDLIRVPFVLRLPDSAPREYHQSLAAAGDSACSVTDILPTLLELAGRELPAGIDGRSLLDSSGHGSERKLLAEDRRYLYRPTRERFNVNLRGKNTSLWRRLKNRMAQKTLIRGFNLKAFIRYPYKLIVTSYRHPDYLSHASLSGLMGGSFFYSTDPVLHVDDVVLSLELFDLEKDPLESRNLLASLSGENLRVQIADRIGDLSEIEIEIIGKKLALETAVKHDSRNAHAQ